MKDRLELIRTIIDCNVNLKKIINEVNNNDDLFALGMDSISSIKIVVALEEEFDFEFEDEKLSFETLHTINNILKYLNQRLKL